MTRSKFGVRTDAVGRAQRTVDNILFASKREAKRYSDLKLLEKAKEIGKITLQPRFKLEVDGILICTYVADFQYLNLATGDVITEDSKGFKTPEYKLKRKLMKAIHGIEISEV